MTSNKYGNAYITGHKFDNTETIMAVTDDGQRTPVVDIETIPPNVVSGGPDQLGGNVVYVTTDTGKMPVTKGVGYKGKAVVESDGKLTESLDVDEVAVRGNSSATKAKKPYKLKFEDKQKPFGMKNDKTWILLANYGDWTLIRSMVAWDLGKMLDGLKWTPDSRFTELFLNGKYLGSYQMVESIKIDKNRVNVDKEAGQVIEFDPHWKADGVPGMRRPDRGQLRLEGPGRVQDARRRRRGPRGPDRREDLGDEDEDPRLRGRAVRRGQQEELGHDRLRQPRSRG